MLRKRIALVIPHSLLQWNDKIVEEYSYQIQKTMTSVVLEAILDYCRIAFDILQDKIGINIFVINDQLQLHTVLTDTNIEEQNYNHICNIFANLNCNQFQIYAMDTLKPHDIIYYLHSSSVSEFSSLPQLEYVTPNENIFQVLIHEKLKPCFHLRSIIIQDIPLKVKSANSENIKGDVEFLASSEDDSYEISTTLQKLKWNRQTSGLGSLKTSIDHLSVTDAIYKLSPLFPYEQASMCLTKQILAAGKNVTLSQERNPKLVSHVMKQHGNEINLHVLRRKWDLIYFLPQQSCKLNDQLHSWIDQFTLYPSSNHNNKMMITMQTVDQSLVQTSDTMERRTKLVYYLNKITSEYSVREEMIDLIEKRDEMKLKSLLQHIRQSSMDTTLWNYLRNIMLLQEDETMVSFMDELYDPSSLVKKEEEEEESSVVTVPFVVTHIPQQEIVTVLQWGSVLLNRFLHSLEEVYISVGFKLMQRILPKRAKLIYEITSAANSAQETIDPFSKTSIVFVVSAYRDEETNTTPPQLLFQFASSSIESLYQLISKQQQIIDFKLEQLYDLFGITSFKIQQVLQTKQLPYSILQKQNSIVKEWKSDVSLLQHIQQTSQIRACAFDGQGAPLYNNEKFQSHRYQNK